MTNNKTTECDQTDVHEEETTPRMESVCQRLLSENLGATTGETLLVVTDGPKRDIGYALFKAGCALDLEAGIIEMRPRERSGVEPPAYVSSAMNAADIVVCPTSTSLTHTRAREEACEAGARVATMPGIIQKMFAGGAITADYEKVEKLTTAITERLTAASEARIESQGELLTLSLENRDGIASDGICREPGSSGNLPSGEGYIAPQEDTATGTLVVDGGLVGVGVIEDPLRLEIDNGEIVDASGKPAEMFLEKTAGNSCARRVCELGIGTNPAADLIGTVLEDEKVYGTAHVAFGDNAGFGGEIECNSHVDVIVREPDVYLDDELVVSGGEIRI